MTSFSFDTFSIFPKVIFSWDNASLISKQFNKIEKDFASLKIKMNSIKIREELNRTIQIAILFCNVSSINLDNR